MKARKFVSSTSLRLCSRDGGSVCWHRSGQLQDCFSVA